MMVMVMMVMTAPVVVVVMMVMVMILCELHARRAAARPLLLVHRLQDRAGIRDGRQQVGIGIGLQHLRRRRQRRSFS